MHNESNLILYTPDREVTIACLFRLCANKKPLLVKDISYCSKSENLPPLFYVTDCLNLNNLIE